MSNNNSTTPGGALGVDTAQRNDDVRTQDRLIYLALNYKSIVPKVLDVANKFWKDVQYTYLLDGIKWAMEQDCLLSRRSYRDYCDNLKVSKTGEKWTPADVGAQMSCYDSCFYAYTKYAGNVENDIAGLLLKLDAISKAKVSAEIKVSAQQLIDNGQYEQGIAEMEKAGLDTAQLSAKLVENGKMPLKANIIKATSVKEKALKWLWAQRIPLGKLTLLFGNGGLGKSMITTDIASRISNGTNWADGASNEKGRVLIITGEDDLSDTVIPRLRACNANLEAIDFVKTVQVLNGDNKISNKGFTLRDLSQLEASIQQGKYRLVIIDPLGAYLDGTDSHKDSDIRQILMPLSQLAEDFCTTILLVAHINKGKGMRASHRVNGSVGIANACRAAYMVVEDGHSNERRLFLPTKMNLAKQQGGLAFRIVESNILDLDGKPLAIVEWLGNVATTADEAVQAAEDMSQGERDGAKAFLQYQLKDGPKSANSLKAEASARGISERTLFRAKDELSVIVKKMGSGSWMWAMPIAAETTLPTTMEDDSPF